MKLYKSGRPTEIHPLDLCNNKNHLMLPVNIESSTAKPGKWFMLE